MRKYILFLSFLISTCSLNGQESKKLLFEIVFANDFKNDKVSVIINNQTIFKNLRLTTDEETGLTGVDIDLLNDGNRTVAKYKNKEILLKEIEPSIILKIFINGYLNCYSINLNNGKYLGFWKEKRINKLVFEQHLFHFEFD